GPTIDLARAGGARGAPRHRRILSEAGPYTFGELLAAALVDELFLTSSPLLVGDAGPGTRLRLVEAADLVGAELRPRLVSLRPHGSALLHRYRPPPTPRARPPAPPPRRSA